MATILPFRAYRYAAKAGALANLATQPYDKITPEMQQRYLERSPYNFVRLALGPRRESDSPEDNVYTRAERHLEEWIGEGILVQDHEPAFYAYFQEFTLPDSGDKVTRKGFIGLGQIEDYANGVVFRHERTLLGPKKDRLELLRRTRTHIEQIFMLYSDPEFAIDGILDRAAGQTPEACVEDEYGAAHKLWRIGDPEATTEITRRMAGAKLLIADGHHRYETGLTYRDENPGLAAARFMIMTLVNMHSPGLKILATHRVVSGLDRLDVAEFARKAGSWFHAQRLESLGALKEEWASPKPDRMRIAVVAAGAEGILSLEKDRRPGELDVALAHDLLLNDALGIGDEAVREQKHLRYVRGLEAAAAEVFSGSAQLALLLEPVTVEQVADVSFSGGVMPQKSTDFYPKLLSGLALYRM
ncbi:MAG: DUF1015 domain-containing protein [Bryobacteraceae bacterium]|nr:DUF1015 domain-containing protein [Bryobacteraceae bacterium]